MNFRKLERTWIVAEIGVNHQGDHRVAADLIRKAADAGADAVKFQTYSAEQYVSTVQPERLHRVRRFQLSREDFRHLAMIAADSGLTFFSTPLHPDDADFLDPIVPLFKISSGDITHLHLIQHVARKNKPIILSTGLAIREEIRAAIDAVIELRPDILDRGQLMLMHCVAAYPTPPNEANLRNIEWLRETFNLPVGYSDHTLGSKACELAVAAGACAIEKHFTYRKEDQAFHDHALSADPKDLRELVRAVRRAETYLGTRERARTPSEQQMLPLMRRSIAAAIDIPANTPVKPEWLTFLRPAWGLPPDRFDTVVGRPLNRPVPAGDLIKPDDLQTD